VVSYAEPDGERCVGLLEIVIINLAFSLIDLCLRLGDCRVMGSTRYCV